jgi:hypothetical protein
VSPPRRFPSELKGWLYYWTPKGIKLIEKNERGRLVLGEMGSQLISAITDNMIDLVAFDPFVKIHTADENDNNAIDAIATQLAQIAQHYGCAVDYIHHHRKGLAATPGDADSGRGAGALKDAARLVYTLTLMTADEAKNFNLTEQERRSLVRYDSAKVNLMKPSADASWFKLVGVLLRNSSPDYPNGDEVQTVEPWTPPNFWKGLSSITLNAILDEISQGMSDDRLYSDHARATDRAAWPIVRRHLPDLNDAQARAMIKTWVKNGVLVAETYYDKTDRKDRQGLRVNPAKRPG